MFGFLTSSLVSPTRFSAMAECGNLLFREHFGFISCSVVPNSDSCLACMIDPWSPLLADKLGPGL